MGSSAAIRTWCVIFALLACATAATAFWKYGAADDEPRAARPAKKLDLPHVVRTVRHVEKYTYLELMDAPGSSYWVAAPHTEIQVGDQVVYSGTHEMRDFHSPSLGVTFDRILFVDLVHALTHHGKIVAGSDATRDAPLRPELAELGELVAPDFDPRHEPREAP